MAQSNGSTDGGMLVDPMPRSETERAIRDLILWVGEDPDREGLRQTPARVVKAFSEMTEGYGADIPKILSKTFESDGYDEIVVLRGIRFTSLCEHHLLPFVGQAAVGYIPGDRVVGLSKLERLVHAVSRRFQIQERMTIEIVDWLAECLDPLGAGVVVRAHHSCMGCRGVRDQDAQMVTSSLVRSFRDKPEARAEFFRMIGEV